VERGDLRLDAEKSSSKSVVSLLELQQGLRMPIVEVWLGLLLGGQERYGLEQQGTFYSAPDEILSLNVE
jgi:hypothetical protein